MSVLDTILDRTRADLAARRQQPIPPRNPPASHRPFAAALAKPGLALIAEYKPKSPSEGELAARVSPSEFAAGIADHATAVSVLVDGPFFGGSWALLQEVRALVDQPVLAKGFFIDPFQLLEAQAAGADAVLLIAEALPGGALAEMFAAAMALGLEVLVEAHAPAQAARAVAVGARVIGINARDLTTLKIDLDAALATLSSLPADRIKVAESGVTTAAQVARLRQAERTGHCDAVLLGTGLYRDASVAHALRTLGLA